MSQKQWKKQVVDEYSMKSCMLIGDHVSGKTTNKNRNDENKIRIVPWPLLQDKIREEYH